MSNDKNWTAYYQERLNFPPRELVKQALTLFQKEEIVGTCIDLGVGAGSDAEYILKNYWKVLACDKEKAAQEIIKERLNGFGTNFRFELTDFENFQFTPVQWINASCALSFCRESFLDRLIENIKENIEIGGRFSGNFFGTEHSWQHLALMSKSSVEYYFRDFEIEYIHEVKEEKTSALGEPIIYHNIDIIAKKYQ